MFKLFQIYIEIKNEIELHLPTKYYIGPHIGGHGKTNKYKNSCLITNLEQLSVMNTIPINAIPVVSHTNIIQGISFHIVMWFCVCACVFLIYTAGHYSRSLNKREAIISYFSPD